MKRRTFLFLSALGLLPKHLQSQTAQRPVSNSLWSNLRLWYQQPAKEWNEALPIGNGRLIESLGTSTAARKVQLYNGRALISVDRKGAAVVSVSSEGLPTAFLNLG